MRLSIPNITVECLAQHLWRELARALGRLPIDTLAVEVGESDGQSASVEARL